jgi:Na+-translocating ferredoxin:NAD+ oxidoreductase RnfD subunit
LFVFFMITDPKTTVSTRWGQCVVAALVAVMEMILRLAEVVDAPYYALFIVGPIANVIELAATGHGKPKYSRTTSAIGAA